MEHDRRQREKFSKPPPGTAAPLCQPPGPRERAHDKNLQIVDFPPFFLA
jgi:hypothetical protein